MYSPFGWGFYSRLWVSAAPWYEFGPYRHSFAISRAVREGDYPVQGTTRKQPVSLRLGFAGDEFGYLIDMGLPKPDITSMFGLDPEIKQETIWHGPTLRPSTTLVERRGPIARIHGENDCEIVADSLASFDSIMTHIADPRNAPEMLVLRESIRAWRFYDHFRTDADSPARLPQIGTRTPVLGNDGSDLAAAIQTIKEIGDNQALDSAVADAFRGGRIEVVSNSGRFTLTMEQHGMLRPLDVAELSDGMLRYLLWIAALLTPRPPALMVLNEPENSLHPDLLGPLARLIARASENSQMIVVTHAAKLIGALAEQPGYHAIELEKELGETRIVGMNQMNIPPWHWPSR